MDYLFFKENVDDEISQVEIFLKSLPISIETRFLNSLEHLVENNGIIDGIRFRKLHGLPFEESKNKTIKKSS